MLIYFSACEASTRSSLDSRGLAENADSHQFQSADSTQFGLQIDALESHGKGHVHQQSPDIVQPQTHVITLEMQSANNIICQLSQLPKLESVVSENAKQKQLLFILCLA